ncbi:MAG TPA: hypothetical protein VNZ58_01075 [Thermomicrobiales bacterium]|nr:hypothetical protein [Thermomicrobiales bacterium]
MFKKGGPVTFAVGAAAGLLGGFMLGILVGKYLIQLISLLYGMIDRRGSSDDDRLKFELLLQ